MKRLGHGVKNKLNMTRPSSPWRIAKESFEYQTIEDIFYKSILNYQFIDHQEYFSLAHKFCLVYGEVDANETVNEHMYLLKK